MATWTLARCEILGLGRAGGALSVGVLGANFEGAFWGLTQMEGLARAEYPSPLTGFQVSSI